MRVLVACEYSGTVRDAFAKLGHDAWSCDILPTDSPGQHYQCDILDVIGNGWDLMIAHPPCTFLSNAGARFLYPNKVLNEDRLKQGMKAKTLFMVMLHGVNIAKVCIENPIPSTVFGLPKYDQIIQPYEYGHPVQKRTCLWLKGLPKLIPTNIVEERQSSKVPGNWFNKGGKDRQKARAKTFQGIADAMAQQWGSPCGS
ncbi:hypothetical protein UFOVP1464_50 [uncultured Caudovirales phage]|uniref:S-adenosyl-L-methionine-dependent methyltransferase n=1 Tax=uncultured Caudovirales phage TaxID=2100421 RepID=A0A6J7XDV7_9CAUD|nr:hypothetical protein UFOVP1103_24 [uncultured Caudovirales phage]CAB4214567.1 hypothetical protein UFOVP1464_50 [uncultured Caudovirales phage]CAB5229272.1 hypothetical protein UFOVP1553_12 [uncultured Caudovirales phage]